MIAELKLSLEGEKLTYRQASNLQGVLMKNIETDYADELHHMPINPYCISIYEESQKNIWRICTVGDETYEKIIQSLMSPKFKEFTIYNGNNHIKIIDRVLTTKQDSDILQECKENPKSQFTINFESPTAFKSKGKYLFYPNMRMIFQNVINKYNYLIHAELFSDIDEILTLMESDISIERYDVKSNRFPLEGTSVPGFMGYITFKVKKNSKILLLMNVLMTFANYTGIGIKTSIGMGHVRID